MIFADYLEVFGYRNRSNPGSDTSRVSKAGSGLGLDITKRIVELHKGKIYVDTDITGYTKGFVIEFLLA
ncbi:MAG: ATP-binding protein [Wujia sp.]